MLVALCLLLLLFDNSLCVDITYHVKEEQSPGTYVGDIAADSQLLDTVPSQDHSLITFTQLQLQRRGSGSSQLFNVTKTGKLYTTHTLDAESLCTYNKECFKIVKVAVRKAKTFIKILKIKVVIKDINDHQPEFPVKQVNLKFSEDDRKGAKRSIPNAIDRDIGVLNLKITYSLEKYLDEPFSLSTLERVDGRSTLEISLDERLDREVKETYNIQVIAKDGGSPPKQTALDVHITVTDVNDNRPIFTEKVYNISMKNTHRKTKAIVVLSATDLDTGKNGKISYHFGPKTSDIVRSHFKLNQNTGEIFVQKLSTSTQTYKLFVDATDEGSPPLGSTAIALVNIINGHNSVPRIDVDFVSTFSDNKAAISEDIQVGSFIAYMMVTDNDIGQNGEVSCDIQHDIFQLSSMDSKEYKVIMKRAVDRETKDHYDITIRCQDKGSPPLQSQRKISIQVTDVNDVQPQFTKDTFNFVTYENQKPNFPIGVINATDPDLGPGGQLTYSLITDNKKDNIPFQVTDYGFISTKQSLDRELKNIYKFKIIVKDNGTPSLNNTANAVVEILDKNDNAPYFTFPSVNPFRLDVHYYLNSKNDITVLKAYDKDSQGNAFLRYEILGSNYQQLFKINSYTGMLSFSRKVYQNDAGTYDLDFVVKDSGTPVLSATTTLSLTLTVSNKTMLKAVDIQSNNMIDITVLIIIVAAAVIVSVVIVVSVTLCVFRCINGSSYTAGKDPPYQCRTEMRQLLYQTNNPVALTRNPEEILNRNTRLIRSTSQLYPEEEESQNEWKFSTTPRRPLPGTQCYNPNDTLSNQKDSGHGWSETGTTKYEDIPGLKNSRNNAIERSQYQDTYLKPL